MHAEMKSDHSGFDSVGRGVAWQTRSSSKNKDKRKDDGKSK
jgi:hypothetical protein